MTGRVPDARETALARRALSGLWRERAAERGLPDPTDLSGSCKFSSLLLSDVFGLEMRGSEDHQFCVGPGGEVVDLNADEPDVRALADPHRHDPSFWMSPDHAESLGSCRPRVARWAVRLRAEIAAAEATFGPEGP